MIFQAGHSRRNSTGASLWISTHFLIALLALNYAVNKSKEA